MVLYAAKLRESATPVESVDQPINVDKKELAKQKRQATILAKKLQKEQEKQQKEQELAQELLEKQEKEKALIAKKELAKEKRRLKKEQKKELLTPPESTVAESVETAVEELNVEKVIEPEKALPIKKRKRKSAMERDVDDAIETISKDQTPPEWFKKYVAGVKNEEEKIGGSKKSRKVVKAEANDMAKRQWDDGLVRDRVRNEVDAHMSRMYQMIFNR